MDGFALDVIILATLHLVALNKIKIRIRLTRISVRLLE